MPWWFRRISAGGRVPAPGPYDRPLQYIDARDLAAFALDRPVGTFDTVSRPGHTTIGLLLDEAVRVSGADAELVWLTPETIERAEVVGLDRAADLDAADRRARRAARQRHVQGVRRRAALPADAGHPARHLGLAPGRGLPRRARSRAGTGLDAEGEARLWAAALRGRTARPDQVR